MVSILLAGVGLLAPAAAAYLAPRKGRSGLAWAGLCFVSPLIAFTLKTVIVIGLQPRGLVTEALSYLVSISGLLPLTRLYLLPSKGKEGSQIEAVTTSKKSPILKWLVVLGALLLPVGSIYVFFIRPFLPVTRKGAYERVLAKGDNYYPDLLKHFPRSTASGVHLVQFFHQPGFLQGGSIWIARFKADDPVYVDGVLALYRPQEARVIEDNYANPPGRRTLTPEEYQMAMRLQWERVCVNLKTEREDLVSLYASYKPLLLSQRLANHGHASGIFVSRQRSEVIYWAIKN